MLALPFFRSATVFSFRQAFNPTNLNFCQPSVLLALPRSAANLQVSPWLVGLKFNPTHRNLISERTTRNHF
jgi:hypothetical protein